MVKLTSKAKAEGQSHEWKTKQISQNILEGEKV
jgi:hypothetical protein